jgi:hypothetical protein
MSLVSFLLLFLSPFLLLSLQKNQSSYLIRYTRDGCWIVKGDQKTGRLETWRQERRNEEDQIPGVRARAGGAREQEQEQEQEQEHYIDTTSLGSKRRQQPQDHLHLLDLHPLVHSL